jgi:hypothetical protein
MCHWSIGLAMPDDAARLLIVMPQAVADPDHHVLLCARQYAATLRKLRAEPDADERDCQTRMLHYLIDAGTSEYAAEGRRRMAPLAKEIQERIENARLPPLERPVTREEAELVRHAFAVPPVALIDTLSADDMDNLADMYEGWAQDRRTGPVDVPRLLGWADGMRALADAVGTDYEPPDKVPGEPDCMTKFLANRMRGEG